MCGLAPREGEAGGAGDGWAVPAPCLARQAALPTHQPHHCQPPAPPLIPCPRTLPLPAPAAVKVAKRELRMECDYRYELQSQQRFKALIAGDPYTAQVGGLSMFRKCTCALARAGRSCSPWAGG